MNQPSTIEIPDWETLRPEIAAELRQCELHRPALSMHANDDGLPHAYHEAGHVVAGVRFGRPLTRVTWAKVIRQRRGGVRVIQVDRDACVQFGDAGEPFGHVNSVRAFIVTCWAGFAAETIYLHGRRYFYCAMDDIRLLRSATPIVERASRGLETADQVERELLADTFRLLWQQEWWDDVDLIAEALRNELTLDGTRVNELLSRRSAIRPSNFIQVRPFELRGRAETTSGRAVSDHVKAVTSARRLVSQEDITRVRS